MVTDFVEFPPQNTLCTLILKCGDIVISRSITWFHFHLLLRDKLSASGLGNKFCRIQSDVKVMSLTVRAPLRWSVKVEDFRQKYHLWSSFGALWTH